MKRYLTLLILCITCSSKGAGGLPVVDVPAFLIAWTNHLESMEKYVGIITELATTKEWLGDASRITNISGAAQVLADLASLTVGRTRLELAAGADSSFAVDYTDAGLYRPVRQTFRTWGGTEQERPDVFKPEAALFSAVAEHDAVHADVTARREKLRTAVRETLVQLQGATNQVEVLKATGVLLAQHAELETVERETAAAANRAFLIDLQNRAAKEREEKAGRQEAASDFRESIIGLQSFIAPSKKKATYTP